MHIYVSLHSLYGNYSAVKIYDRSLAIWLTASKASKIEERLQSRSLKIYVILSSLSMEPLSANNNARLRRNRVIIAFVRSHCTCMRLYTYRSIFA